MSIYSHIKGIGDRDVKACHYRSALTLRALPSSINLETGISAIESNLDGYDLILATEIRML